MTKWESTENKRVVINIVQKWWIHILQHIIYHFRLTGGIVMEADWTQK